jgi:hypothetical protein
MKRFLMTSGAAAVLALGLVGSAWAVDTTGEIDITGSVGAKCTVITGGPGPNGANFGATVPLGELSDANGHLRSDIQSSSAIGVLTLPFTLSCSGANAAVTVQADPLANAAAAPTGYANRIDYTANAHFLLIAPVSSTSTLDVTDASSVAGATPGSFGSGKYLQNVANNVTITAYSFGTASTATDVLVAGAYAGKILVTITPS